MKLIFAISLILLAGCVSIPKQAGTTITLLGNQIAESKQSHLDLIDRWGEESRKRADQFLEYKFIPEFIMNFMSPEGAPYKNLKEQIKKECEKDRADEIKEIVFAISSRIEKTRKEIIDAIDRQVQELKDKVTYHYAESERLHRALSANIYSVVKGQEFEKRIREAMNKPLKEIAPIKDASEHIDNILKEIVP